MSWGQSFGAFAGGMSSGYSGGKSFHAAVQQRKQPEKTKTASATQAQQPPVQRQESGVDTQYEDQTWQMLRDLSAQQDDTDESEVTSYSASGQQQQSGNGMSINSSTIQQFMPSSSAGGGMSGGSLALGGAGGGVGGSGLMGSAGGAMSAGANGGASFGLGGSLVGGSGTVGGSTFAASAGGSAAGGAASGGAAAGGSAAGGLASAGPWAALIAAIGLNENYQKKTGNREMSHGKQIEHAITGKVVEDDAGVWGEKVDKGNKLGIKGDMQVGADFASFDFKNAAKGLKDTFGVKTIKKIFGG